MTSASAPAVKIVLVIAESPLSMSASSDLPIVEAGGDLLLYRRSLLPLLSGSVRAVRLTVHEQVRGTG
jgi:hypothetical protein